MSAKITAALHQVMSAVGYVQKTGENQFHNYRYAGEADLLSALRPAMLEAGLLLIPSVETVSPIDENGITTVRMAYTLAHKDGDVWPEKLYAAGAGGDKNKAGIGDKGLYKALTGANKYLLFKLFQIETGDDPENDEDAPAAAAKAKRAAEQDRRPAPRTEPAPARPAPAAGSISQRASAAPATSAEKASAGNRAIAALMRESANGLAAVEAWFARARPHIDELPTKDRDDVVRLYEHYRAELGAPVNILAAG